MAIQTVSNGRVVHFIDENELTIWNGTTTDGQCVSMDVSEIGGIKTDSENTSIIFLDRTGKELSRFDVASKANAVGIARSFVRWKARNLTGADALFAKRPHNGGGFRSKNSDSSKKTKPLKKKKKPVEKKVPKEDPIEDSDLDSDLNNDLDD